jgi:hypothetical protein
MTTPTPSQGRPHEVPLDDTAVLPMYPARPASAKRKKLPWLIAAAAVVVGVCCGGAVIRAAVGDSDTAQTTGSNAASGNRFVGADVRPTPSLVEPTGRDPLVGVSAAKPTTAGPKVSAKPTATRASSPRPVPTTTTPKPPMLVSDPRFGTCREANAAGYGPYRRGIDPEYGWYRDRNGDGLVCERR